MACICDVSTFHLRPFFETSTDLIHFLTEKGLEGQCISSLGISNATLNAPHLESRTSLCCQTKYSDGYFINILPSQYIG